MQELETIIGLEIHIQINTQSKMFCSCSNDSEGVDPNTNICPTCVGVVGTLPLINKSAVEKTILLGLATDCEIAHHTKWDRKNYFYPDLPKGYQISQYDMPLCAKGKISIYDENGEIKTIRLNRIHLEEDAAKNVHTATETLVDYNRSSTPLMEMVTEADLRSTKEAGNFLREVRRIARYLKVSDADLEKGHMRCDASISMRPVGDEKLYPRTEIKNLNSFKMVEKALEYEICRQTKQWEEGKPNDREETVLWDDDKQKTQFMRDKEGAADYRYFPEPDIPEVELEQSFIDDIKKGVVELPHSKMKRYVDWNIDPVQAESLVEDMELAEYFDQLVELADSDDLKKASIKWFLGESLPAYKKANDEMKVSAEDTFMLIKTIDSGKISRLIGKQVFEKAFEGGASIADGIKQAEEAAADIDLDAIIQEVIAANPHVIEQYKSGKEQVINALIGQCIGKTKGAVPANEVREALLEAVKKV